MMERNISARNLLSYALWTACLVLLVTSWEIGSDDVGRLALVTCGAAITASVKCMFIGQREHMRTVMAVTESVRQLRRY